MTLSKKIWISLGICLVAFGVFVLWYLSINFGYYSHPKRESISAYMHDVYLNRGQTRISPEAAKQLKEMDRRYGKVKSIRIKKDWWAWPQKELELEVFSVRGDHEYCEGFVMNDLGLVTSATLFYGPIRTVK